MKQNTIRIGAVLLAFSTSVLPRAYGDPDRSFGSDGVLSLANGASLGFGSIPIGDMDTLAKGGVQFVMCDTACELSNLEQLHVYRLRSEGTRDDRFGSARDGHVLLPLDQCTSSGLRRLEIETTSDQGALISTGACLIKLAADGAVDEAYGDRGRRKTDVGTNVLLAVDNMQRAVMVGQGTGFSCVAQRFLPTGDIDSTFGAFGTTRIGNCVATSMALHRDGRILLGGGQQVVGLTRDGQLDIGFGVFGRSTLPTPAGLGGFHIGDIAIDLIGNIVLAGRGFDALTGCCVWAARVREDGDAASLLWSRAFTSSSINTLSPFFESSSHVLPLPTGQVLVAFNLFPTELEHRTDFALLMLNADGTVESRFGRDGLRYYLIPDLSGAGRSAGYDQLHAAMVDNGKVTLLGRTLFEEGNDGQNAKPISLLRVSIASLFDDDFESAQ